MTRAMALVAPLLLVACGSGPVPAAEFGERLFSDPRLSESSSNFVSCASCHSVRPEGDANRILPGHTLHDSAFRPSYWGGQEPRLLDAINHCYAFFMRGYPPLAPEDDRARALYEYLVSISPDAPAAPLPLTIVRDVSDVARGERPRGEQVYRQACQSCHGAVHSAEGRPSALAPALPEVTAEYAEIFPGVPPSLVVVEKVRHGGFFGIGGTMPPYAREMLSDEDLGALLTYLGL